jgi:hypothetical protein
MRVFAVWDAAVTAAVSARSTSIRLQPLLFCAGAVPVHCILHLMARVAAAAVGHVETPLA